MPDPLVIRNAVTGVFKGLFALAVEEVRDGMERRQRIVLTPLDTTRPLPEFSDFPSLDEAPLGTTIAPDAQAPGVPDDLFAVVVGLDHEKQVLRHSINVGAPLHAYVVGPPGSAKSLLLEEIRRCPDTRYVVGVNLTAAGLREMFSSTDVAAPKILLIDELDRAKPEAHAALLSIMDGKVTAAVHGQQQESSTDVLVIAAGNTANLPPALRSRFIELTLQNQTEAERHQVIVTFLTARQGMDAAKAEEVAALVAPASGDTRDAVQIAQVYMTNPELAREMAARLGTGAGAEVAS